MRGKKPPDWKNFDFWVLISAGIGLGIAVLVFLGLRKFLFNVEIDGTGDIITATATALGGLTIGGVAIMQYRKHKWAEYQAKLDEDSRIGERFSKAIEHLSVEHLHSRLGAIHEFKNLADDSPIKKEGIVQILTTYINVYQKNYQKNDLENFSDDIWLAARVLSQLTRELIEKTAEKASKKNMLRPPQCVFEAVELLSSFGVEEYGRLRNEYLEWHELKANWLNIRSITLQGAYLFEASLQGAGLGSANLQGAYLAIINLQGADLSSAKLQGAKLTFAKLQNAGLISVKLQGTDLRDAYFNEKTNFGEDSLKTIIDEHTKFPPGVREKYFPEFGKEKTQVRDVQGGYRRA
ncbi:MAG: pentapeptide repeat-containing protein [Oscillospiraceae bacterium]|nr:pentapeptide repeat-containing protein [Oscillospiraceae bacterium]